MHNVVCTEVGSGSQEAGVGSEEAQQDFILDVRNVSKRFCRDLKRSLFYGLTDIGRELVGRPPDLTRLRKNEFWALQDVNLSVTRGTAVGLVGLNGCGKTTLMRVISGLIKPTTGEIVVRGRLAPLLALGAGFNQVLTGRENIYTNMSVLGLTTEEIEERFDEVVAFSEIGYAIDAPVQTYSSGMVARLGFACAIHTQPDLILIDEVMAVGDLKFRRKCLDRLYEMKDRGMSLLIVHHSPDLILSLCDRAMYLHRGRVVDFGSASSIVGQYEKDLVDRPPVGAEQAQLEEAGVELPVTSNKLEILEILLQRADAPGETIHTGQEVVFQARFRVCEPILILHCVISIFKLPSADTLANSLDERRVLSILSRRDGASVVNAGPGEYTVQVRLPYLGLMEGIYQAKLAVYEPLKILLASQRSERFFVQPDTAKSRGIYNQQREWVVTSSDGGQLQFFADFSNDQNASGIEG